MRDPLPDLSEERPAAADEIASFREKGHTVVRGIATAADLVPWAEVIREVVEANAEGNRVAELDETVRDAFVQIQNLWCLDERVRRFVGAARFARVAADLLGVDGVRIYHDQAIFKPAGGTGTPFHQDQYFFPLDGDQVLTMWLPLVPVTREVGSMTFASGSHRLGYLGDLGLSVTGEQEIRRVIEGKGLPLETHGAMAVGDATFHAGWTLHAAPPNPTDQPRPVMTVIWFADGLRGIEPQHDWHVKDYEKWLPGVRPGELAASPLNPLVWQRR